MSPEEECEEGNIIRPVLEGKDLEQWTAIYQGLCVLYQRKMLGDDSISDMTWRRWSDLTGKDQSIKGVVK